MHVDDPKLTAYALGELTGAERADVEAYLASSAEARQAVASIRETAAMLTSALTAEEGLGLGDRRIEELLDAGEQHPLRMRRDDVYHVITHPVPEPRRFRTGLLALAAALVIVLATVSILVSVLFRDRIFHPGHSGGGGGSLAAAGHGSVEGDAAATSPTFAELLPEPNGVRPQDVPALTLTPLSGNAATTRRGSDGAGYALHVENPFQDASRSPVSSFPFHPQDDSYAAVKEALAARHLPARGSVRVEELVNAFDYGYAAPTDGRTFAAYTEVASCPWEPKHRLVRIGLRAREEADASTKVADDLRVSVEFNPQRVTAYRLIGFDRRLSTRPTDAAPAHPSVRSGQALTALYEVIPAAATPTTNPLKYQDPPHPTKAGLSTELLTLNLRYALPQGQGGGQRVEQAICVDDPKPYIDASPDFRFAAAVASYGLILTDSPHKGTCSYDQVLALAQSASFDLDGERAAFCDLVRHTRELQ